MKHYTILDIVEGRFFFFKLNILSLPAKHQSFTKFTQSSITTVEFRELAMLTTTWASIERSPIYILYYKQATTHFFKHIALHIVFKHYY